MLQGSILQKLRDAHLAGQTDKIPLNFGVYYKNTLVALCHALEDALLTSDYSALVITAFQQGKWYLQEADRYAEIAERSRRIVIMAVPGAGFAEHPTGQKANVDLVDLEASDPVAQEWHLIIVSPDYTAMVLCQELSETDYGAAGMPTDDRERKFYGLWTFDPSLVMETAELAIAHLETYRPTLQQQLAQQFQQLSTDIANEQALCRRPTVEHLGGIVSRVVDYLQTSEATLQPVRAKTSVTRLPSHSLDQNLVSNELQAFLRVAELIDQADLSNPSSTAEVAALAETVGQLVDLPVWQIHRLRLAGLLHRMAFLPSEESVITPHLSERYKEGAPDTPLSCPLQPGTQVLRTMPRLRAIATIVTHLNEHWDGSGQPAGLAGDEIPIESRILGLVADFQHRVVSLQAKATEPEADVLTQALAACQEQQGQHWDPKLVEVLALLVNGLQQGLALPVAVPKIAAGMWLLDSHGEEPVLH